MNKKIIGLTMSFIILFSFNPISYVNAGGLVPDCGKTVKSMQGGKEISTISDTCDFDDLMQMINGVINFMLFKIATPFIALIIMYTGYLFLTAGGSAGQTEKAKHILSNVIFGYILALIAWLIINTILSSFGVDSSFNMFLAK